MALPAGRGASHDEARSPFQSSSDALLVRRVRMGDVAAFEAVFGAYWKPLCSFAFRYLRSADDAEEAIQTVFARIWRGRAAWHVPGTLHDYLYLAARNACRDRLRHDAVVRRWCERRVREIRSCEDAAPAEQLLATAELESAIERALAELPEKRRLICELRFGSDLSYAEIARRVGVSTKTVETQIARGLKSVRAHLQALRQ